MTMHYLLFLFTFLPLTQPKPQAIITGQLAVRKVEKVFIVRQPLVDWLGYPIDSTFSDSSGFFHFALVPDVNSEYGIVADSSLIAQGIGLSGGDSLHFVQNRNSLFANISYDRKGANTLLREFNSSYEIYKYEIMSMAFRSYDSSIQETEPILKTLADSLRLLSPPHTFLLQRVEYELSSFRAVALASYLYYRITDNSGRQIDSLDTYVKIVDSLVAKLPAIIPKDPDLNLGWAIYMLNVKRWNISHKNASASDYFSNFFNIAISMPQEIRDYAIYLAMQNTIMVAPHFSSANFDVVEFLENQFKKIDTLIRDRRFAELYEMHLKELKSVAIGSEAPSFSLPDDHGANHNLSDFMGTIVFLDFWGTWCGPCIESFSWIKRLEKEFRKRRVAFVSIALEADGGTQWRRMIEQKKLPGLQLLANGQFGSSVGKIYHLEAAPTFILIDQKGKIAFRITGVPPEGEIESMIKKLLS